MKRIALIILSLIFVLLSSCKPRTFNPEKGLENFSVNDSESSLCCCIMPENFIDNYDYEDGDYYFSSLGFIYKENYIDRVLIYLKYDNKTYLDAKADSTEKLILSDEQIGECNGYKFFLNESPSICACDFLDGKYFPQKFLSFGYNDENNTLVFIGFYVVYPEVEADVAELVADDWPAFLEKYYGEWYFFS